MVDFRGLFEERSLNAPLAWLFTGVLVIGGIALVAAPKLLWTGFAVVTVAVVAFPPIRTRDPTTTMPAELVALVSVPVVLQAAGLFLEVTPFVAIAGLALLVVIALDGFTSLEMAPRFAALFVAITTMAFAGTWVVVEFAVDALLGTEFVGGQRELNLTLLIATVVGVIAGVVFAAYFRRTDGAAPLQGGRLTPSFGTTGDGIDGPGGSDAAEPLARDDGVEGSRKHRLAIRALQVLLVGIVLYSLATVNGKLFVNSAVPLALTFLPAIVRRRYGYPMHANLALLISVVATLHAVGALGPYAATDWYDTVTHALSSTLVAGVGYAIAHGLELHTDSVDFSPRFRGAFVVIFVLAVGVVWELFEFASGLAAGLVGGEVLAQYGASDIVKDLVFNTVGAFLVALFGTDLFRRPARALAGSVGGLLRRG